MSADTDVEIRREPSPVTAADPCTSCWSRTEPRHVSAVRDSASHILPVVMCDWPSACRARAEQAGIWRRYP